MSMDDTNESRFFQRLVDIGTQNNLSITESRYTQAANIAAMLGALFHGIWLVLSALLTNAPVISIYNASLGLLFLTVLLFNNKGRRVLLRAGFLLQGYTSILLFLYLGLLLRVAVICFLMIILPYLTFPKKARKLAHGLVCCLLNLNCNCVTSSKVQCPL